MGRTLTLGFSPCPNDTFIFDAMVNGLIDTGDLLFEVIMEDVETLNTKATQGKLDITKLSLPAFFESSHEYILLNAGSALGKGVGPLLVSATEEIPRDITNHTIAIPGEHTTANLLLAFAYPRAKKKIPMIFSSIEDAVLEGKADLGVIIHENRFTYQQKGLHKVVDLGDYWETEMHCPIPLGSIAIKRSIDMHTALQVDRLIKESLQYAFEHLPEITDYVKINSQAMDEEVMRKHISLYVNDYTLGLGNEGKEAILKLEEVYSTISSKGTTAKLQNLFLDNQ